MYLPEALTNKIYTFWLQVNILFKRNVKYILLHKKQKDWEVTKALRSNRIQHMLLSNSSGLMVANIMITNSKRLKTSHQLEKEPTTILPMNHNKFA